MKAEFKIYTSEMLNFIDYLNKSNILTEDCMLALTYSICFLV